MKLPSQTVGTIPLAIYPVQLRLICEARSNKTDIGEKGALNTLLVVATTTFIESFMSALLERLCDQSFENSEINRIHHGIIMKLREEINSKGFADHRKLFKSLTGNSFAEYSPDTWKSIETLFNIRNKLAHGRSIRVAYYISDKPKSDKIVEGDGIIENMNPIQDYLREKKLLPENSYSIGPYDIISDKVILHFIEQTYKFIEDCNSKLITEFNIVSVFMLDHAMKDLRNVLDSIKDQ